MTDKKLQCSHYIKSSVLLERKNHRHTRAERTTREIVCSTPHPEVPIQQMFNEKSLQNAYSTPRPVNHSPLCFLTFLACLEKSPSNVIQKNPTGASAMRNTESKQIFPSLPL